jgi:hypothetical protein
VKKLSNQGVSHILLPMLVMALVAVVGVVALYRAHAATSPPASTSATAAPVIAANDINGVHICLVNGSHGCVGAPTLGSGDKVELTSDGRVINELDKGLGTYKLQFDADHSKCVGVASSRNITVRDCSAGESSNVLWEREKTSNGVYWVNEGIYGSLGSDNTIGHQLYDCPNQCNGWYSLWNR